MNEQEVRDLVLSSIRQVIGNPLRYGLTWQRLPGTVVDGSDPAAIILILDGTDTTTTVPAVSLTGGFETGSRVMVDQVPPSGLYVIGELPASPSPGYRYTRTVYFSATTIINPDDYTGIRAIRQRMVGGGGGGGGSGAPVAGSAAVAGGGGAGGYSESFLIAPSLSGLTITVGTGGTGGAAGVNNGNVGTQTIGAGGFNAAGGGGGEAGATGATSAVTAGGTGGGASGDLTIGGSDGGNGMRAAGIVTMLGYGAGSMFGSIRRASSADTGGAGLAARPYGSGGSGGFSQSSVAAQAGGDGSDGLVIWDLYV